MTREHQKKKKKQTNPNVEKTWAGQGKARCDKSGWA